MKTPYIGGHVQPKAKPAGTDDRAQELQAIIVRERINHKNELAELKEKHAANMQNVLRRYQVMVAVKNGQLQRQRWYMGFLCFLFLILGMILGDALAPYNLC